MNTKSDLFVLRLLDISRAALAACSKTQQIATNRKLFIAIAVLTISMCGLQNVFAQTAPYPTSDFITAVDFNWSTRVKLAPGSDNWPITWSDDDHQYTSAGSLSEDQFWYKQNDADRAATL